PRGANVRVLAVVLLIVVGGAVGLRHASELQRVCRFNNGFGRGDTESLSLGCSGENCVISLGQSCNLGLFLLWHILHFIVTFWYFALRIANALESCLISSGLLKKYKALCSGKIQCLAIVMDSKDADQTSKVIELLQWLGALGVKYVCLYDTEGVLKKSKEAITGSGRFSHAKSSEEAAKTDPLLDQEIITVEFASFSDGKAAVVKAANLLFVKYYLGGEQEEPILSESHVAEALEAIGCGGPDPDLLLVYGPGRCHLGFPAWRIRYTEIV
ncbi:hypothetical protein RJ640_016431, partial [Escallonia rubra]